MRLLGIAASVATLIAGQAMSAEPKSGGTLTYSYHPEPTAISTITTTAVPVSIIATKIYESLLEYKGPGLEPKPGLAESWTVSPDQLTYTFKLRPNVVWHDGEPLTSSDVKFSVEKIVLPFHSRGKTYFSKVESIETPDDLTVLFNLSEPVPFFLRAFQPGEAPIMPEHGFTEDEIASGEVRQAGIMEQPIGTGPFKLKEWSRGSYIILEKNENYWKEGKPYLDQIVMRVIPDGASRAIMLESGELDLVPMSGLPPAEMQRLAGLEHIETSQDGSEALGPIMWLEVNLRGDILSNKDVRKALSMAIDRERLVNVIWYGNGKPARGPIVSGNPTYFDASLPELEHDPEKAEELLDQAGFERGEDGVRFKLTQNTLPYGEEWVRQAEYIRQAFRKIGVDVQSENLDMGGWLQKIYTDWNYDFTSNFTHNYADPSIGVQRAFNSNNIKKGASFSNSMNYSNPRIDELFLKAGEIPEGEERKRVWSEIQHILNDELPVIFLMEIGYTHVFNQRVHGLITNGISMYSNWDSVWVE